ncbi:unnamed protein product [Nippostrongylus brasiliensis]|uniref:Methyltransf_21 domain-containing protein n=1 Tax=Nippostrongylus brasiliensis TaxID=27835 RepID=A0A0N4YEA3_NIPBR|nr:unnamed protein product [Nippostrongylus brasiliensis]
MAVKGITEKIRAAAELVSVSYDTCEPLILAKTATEESSANFFTYDVEGVTLDSVFVGDFTRKELNLLAKSRIFSITEAAQVMALRIMAVSTTKSWIRSNIARNP